MKALGGISFIIFAIAWSGLVIFFDMKISPNTIKQIQSQNYPSVEGRIIESTVISHPAAKGAVNYSALIQYQYGIGPVIYGATRLRYDSITSSGREWAEQLVREHPVGPVRVYFNPAHLGDAVLEKGIGGETLMLILLLTPFHVVMLGFWIASIAWVRYKSREPVAGGANIRRIGGKTRVRLVKLTAFEVAVLALLALSFGSIFIVGLTTGFHPSIKAASAAWITILVGTLGFAAQRWLKNHSGNDDLIIDDGARTISLPLTFGRTTRETFDFPGIRGVVIEKFAHSTKNGRTTYSYAPALRLKDKKDANTTIVDWYDQQRATAFAAWLRQQLGLPAA